MEKQSGGFTEDLKNVPDDAREAAREVEQKLNQAVDDRPVVQKSLDLRLVVVSALIALVVAVVVRLLGAGYPLSMLLFLALFVGLWIGLARSGAARRPSQVRTTSR